jgi:PmbA protein
MNKETYSQNVVETSVSVVQSAVQGVRTKNIAKSATRIYDGESIGIAGSLGVPDLDDQEKRAREALEHKIPYPFLPAEGSRREERIESTIEDPGGFVAEVETLMSELATRHKEFSFSNKVNNSTTTVQLKNDRGLDYSYTASITDISLVVKDKSSANMIDTFVGYEGPAYDREKVLRSAHDACEAFLNPVDLEEGVHPVCFFTDDVTYQTKLLESLNGLMYGSGGSLFSSKVGEKLFSERFTLRQSRRKQDGIYRSFFDFEGTINPEEQFTLIENGVLKAPYTNRNYAKKFDLPLTGSASGDYDSVPDLGVPQLVIESAGKTAAELLDGRPALLIYIASGGDFTPDGTYATPVQAGYVFDGKRFTGRAPEVSVSSHLYKMFGDDFIGISSDSILAVEPSRVFIANMKVSKG